ncbi:MAG: chromosomal replication initiator protein DnaA [Bacteroidales bacterium]|nr:chromosomal replication initiator protein DnaA [Bacteroidales bacterium]
MTQKTHTELWEECRVFLRDVLEPSMYETWFRDVNSLKFEDNKLVLSVKSSFFVDTIEERFQDILRAGIKKVYGEGIELYYYFPTIKNDPQSGVSLLSENQSTTIRDQVKAEPANPFRQPTRQNFDPQLNPKYNFANYCESESNRIARSIGESIGENPRLKTFNPLFLFGPSGSGKTHLIQAIGIRLKEKNPQARVLYVTARLFQSQYTAARNNINDFFAFYQSIDCLIIDDIQDLQNMPGTQNTFFHIFNHLHQHDRQIIMSSDCAPSDMEGFEARLLSRFKWGIQVKLDSPDVNLRRDVLRLKSEQNGIYLPAEVAEYIVNNVTGSVREIEGIIGSLIAHATMHNKEISIDLAEYVVSNCVKINRATVNFEMITDAVAQYFNIQSDLLFTKSRKREISDPRQIVMYLSKKIAKMPLTTIGHKLGRSHATVIHGCDNIEDRLATDKKLVSDISAIEALLKH